MISLPELDLFGATEGSKEAIDGFMSAVSGLLEGGASLDKGCTHSNCVDCCREMSGLAGCGDGAGSWRLETVTPRPPAGRLLDDNTQQHRRRFFAGWNRRGAERWVVDGEWM